MTTLDHGTRTAVTQWLEPEAVRPRGTLLLFVGRGETPGVYQRFGSRLAADAFRVAVVTDDDVDALLDDPALARPAVAVGSDTGALAALRLAASRPDVVDAVITAGLPGPADLAPLDDLASRSACPAHRGVLEREQAHAPTLSLVGVDLPALVDSVSDAGVAVPYLALHGAADPVSPVDLAVERYRSLGAAQISLVEGGLHDILNDVSHRSVAATVVLFLERLRLGPTLPAVVRDATPLEGSS